MTDSEITAFLFEIKRLNRKVERLTKLVDTLRAENKRLVGATERVLPEPVFYKDGKPMKGKPRK